MVWCYDVFLISIFAITDGEIVVFSDFLITLEFKNLFFLFSYMIDVI